MTVAYAAEAAVAKDIFGDGIDGDYTTLADNETLTRDMYYDNLTIAHTNFKPSGYRIFVKNKLTINSGRDINANGNPGAGQTGGAAIAAGYLGASALGGDGGNAGAPGNNGGDTVDSLGGNGGAGGAGAGQAAGAAGTATAPAPGDGSLRADPQAALARTFPDGAVPDAIEGGGGGGGGGGDGNVGGGGGGGAGILVICARIIENNGTISADGGAGADGNAGGNCGGGGGGGGGTVILIYQQFIGDAPTAALGAKGLLSGTGSDGNDGVAGTVITVKA